MAGKGHNYGLCRKCGKEHIISLETRQKINETREGKTYEEIYGPERAKEIKEKIGRAGVKKKSKINCKLCNKELILTEIESKKRKYCSRKCFFNFIRGKTLEEIYGTEKAREIGRKISVGVTGKTKGKLNGMYGRTPAISSSYGKTGYRKDLQQYFRSTWEANFVRCLNLLKIAWVYEPKRFYFGESNPSYCPDFYLPKHDLWIEISGWANSEKKKRLGLLKIYYPDIDLVHIAEEIWKKYFNPYKEIIAGWEN